MLGTNQLYTLARFLLLARAHGPPPTLSSLKNFTFFVIIIFEVKKEFKIARANFFVFIINFIWFFRFFKLFLSLTWATLVDACKIYLFIFDFFPIDAACEKILKMRSHFAYFSPSFYYILCVDFLILLGPLLVARWVPGGGMPNVRQF